jgi:hypothetical protein
MLNKNKSIFKARKNTIIILVFMFVNLNLINPIFNNIAKAQNLEVVKSIESMIPLKVASALVLSDMFTISVVFNKNIMLGSAFSSITLKDLEGNDVDIASKEFVGNTLNIKVSSILEYNKEYLVAIPNNAITDIEEVPMEKEFTQSLIIQTGNTFNNIRNNGLAAVKGEWIYYKNTYDEGKLYRIKNDATDRTKICDDISDNISVIGDWIYYRSISDGNKIYKVKIDGTSKTNIYPGMARNINVVGQWVFFTSGNNNIYKIKTDGTSSTQINTEASDNLYIIGDWIYYINQSDRKVYKVKTDASVRVRVFQDNTLEMSVQDDWIYYRNLDDNGAIYKVKTDSTNKIKLNYNDSSFLNVSDDWIYFRSQNDWTLSRIKIDGSNLDQLSTDKIGNMNIINDWIYYEVDDGNWSLYKIKTDGTLRQQLSVLNDLAGLTGLTAGDSEVKLRWNEVANAMNYVVSRAEVENGEYKKLVDTKALEFYDTELNHGSNYWYKVSAMNISGDIIASKNINVSTDYEYGNKFSNIANKGLAVSSGEYIYYTDDDYDGISRINKDGTNQVKINKGRADNLNIIGNWIYYRSIDSYSNSSINKVKIDGTENTTLFYGKLDSICVVGDKIYFVNDGRICRLNLAGTDLTYITSNANISNIYNIDIKGDWIFYNSKEQFNISNSTYYSYTINKIRLNGSDKTQITSYRGCYNEGIFNIVGDTLYYSDFYKDYYSQSFKVSKINIDGTGETKILDEMVSNMQVDNNWIYYISTSGTNYNYSGKLYRVSLDGSVKMKLVDNNVRYINIIGDWIYFINEDDKNLLYRVKTDGTQMQRATTLNDLSKLYASASSDSEINISWNVVYGAIVYSVYRKEDNGVFTKIASVQGQTHIDKGLQNNTAYTYRIDAKNSYGVVIDSELTSTVTDKEHGNTNGNINNEGLVVTKGDWNYYIDSYNRIVKKSIDGSINFVICEDESDNLNVVGGWVYYRKKNDGNKIYKISVDGTKKIKVTDAAADCIIVIGDTVYYKSISEGGKIYKTDGINIIKLNDDNSDYLNISGNWIYYRNNNDSGKIYKIDVEGKNRTRLFNAENVTRIDVVSDQIYFVTDRYTGQDEPMGEYNLKLFRIGINGKLPIKISDERIQSLNYYDETIFYISYGNVYRMNMDGSNVSKIIDGNAEGLNTSSNWIYYRNMNDGGLLYKAKNDGTDLKIVIEQNEITALKGKAFDDGSIKIDWNRVPGVDIYNISRREANSSAYIKILSTVENSYIDLNLRPLTSYVYKVEAVDSSGNIISTKAVTASTDAEHGNTSGNINNMGLVKQKGDWIYYVNSEARTIYKMLEDGSSKIRINQEYSSRINVVGDWIYYRLEGKTYGYFTGDEGKIFKIKTDGTERIKVNDEVAESFVVIGDWIYYSGFNATYKIKSDGTNKTLIDSHVGKLYVSGELIYINAGYYGIYKVKVDGTESIKIVDGSIIDMVIDGEWIYYSNYSSINKIRNDGTNKLKIKTINSPQGLNISGDWIYYLGNTQYYNGISGGRIYRINNDGTGETAVNSCYYSGNISVGGDWIYYKNNENRALYRVKGNGLLDHRLPIYQEEDVQASLLSIDESKILGSNLSFNNIIGNLNLPSKGYYNTTISWSSSDESVLDRTGRIMRAVMGEGDKQVNLKATVCESWYTGEKSWSLTIKQSDKLVTVSNSYLGGVYNNEIKVDLNAQDDAVIYYTVDGSVPTVTSNVYKDPLIINKDTTLRYFAMDEVGNHSQFYTESYTVKFDKSRDINNDGIIDIMDIAELAKSYSMKNGDAGWKSWFDLNNDNVIDIFDMIMISKMIQ